MIVRKFLLWARTANVEQRAAATRALAQGYLFSAMSPMDRQDAETAFLALTHDPSPLVRRALAEVLAPAPQTPRSLVVALVAGGGEPAALMLQLSPRLADEELVDAAAVGDDAAQCAIASREHVSLGVAAALAEIACLEAVMLLLANDHAEILPGSYERMLERFGDDATLRETMMARADLPPDLLHVMAGKVSEALAQFVAGCGWLGRDRCDRVVKEARETVAIDLAVQADQVELQALLRRLRQEGRLTPALMLRALVFGRPALAEAGFADLAQLALPRARALMYDRSSAGFASLYRKAGMPAGLFPAFQEAVRCLGALHSRSQKPVGLRAARMVLERVIAVCETEAGSGGVLALLRRFEADCARAEAAQLADGLADDAALMLVIDADPRLLMEHVDSEWSARLARLAA